LDYTAGKLDEFQRQAFASHLASCKSCREFAEKIKESMLLLEEEKAVEFDPYMFTRILAIIDAPKQPGESVWIRLAWQPALIAVVVFLMVLAGIHIGSNYQYQRSITDDYAAEVYYLNDIHDTESELLLVTE
jgi:predicted anti-sigma-YlaC factor YlaD